jgi:hypothetical protein
MPTDPPNSTAARPAPAYRSSAISFAIISPIGCIHVATTSSGDNESSVANAHEACELNCAFSCRGKSGACNCDCKYHCPGPREVCPRD